MDTLPAARLSSTLDREQNMIRRLPKSPNPFVGVWRIVEMELWDKDYIDLEGPGFIKFDKGGNGHFRFGAVQGDLDCRVENYAEIERIEMAPCTAACSFTAETNPHFEQHSRRGLTTRPTRTRARAARAGWRER